jgi:hypothetical protein
MYRASSRDICHNQDPCIERIMKELCQAKL